MALRTADNADIHWSQSYVKITEIVTSATQVKNVFSFSQGKYIDQIPTGHLYMGGQLYGLHTKYENFCSFKPTSYAISPRTGARHFMDRWNEISKS